MRYWYEKYENIIESSEKLQFFIRGARQAKLSDRLLPGDTLTSRCSVYQRTAWLSDWSSRSSSSSSFSSPSHTPISTRRRTAMGMDWSMTNIIYFKLNISILVVKKPIIFIKYLPSLNLIIRNSDFLTKKRISKLDGNLVHYTLYIIVQTEWVERGGWMSAQTSNNLQ